MNIREGLLGGTGNGGLRGLRLSVRLGSQNPNQHGVTYNHTVICTGTLFKNSRGPA